MVKSMDAEATRRLLHMFNATKNIEGRRADRILQRRKEG
jgi:hypothetical protein